MAIARKRRFWSISVRSPLAPRRGREPDRSRPAPTDCSAGSGARPAEPPRSAPCWRRAVDRVIAAARLESAVGSHDRAQCPLIGGDTPATHKALGTCADQAPAGCSRHPRAAHGMPEIVDQHRELPAARLVAPDHHQIETRRRLGLLAQQQPRRFLEPPSGPVANHCVADFLGDGKSQPRRIAVTPVKQPAAPARVPAPCDPWRPRQEIPRAA